MDWITQNLQILATLGSALGVYIMLRNSAKKDVAKIECDLKDIKTTISQVNLNIESINLRLTKLEGRFEERGYWESRITGTEIKK